MASRTCHLEAADSILLTRMAESADALKIVERIQHATPTATRGLEIGAGEPTTAQASLALPKRSSN